MKSIYALAVEIMAERAKVEADAKAVEDRVFRIQAILAESFRTAERQAANIAKTASGHDQIRYSAKAVCFAEAVKAVEDMIFIWPRNI